MPSTADRRSVAWGRPGKVLAFTWWKTWRHRRLSENRRPAKPKWCAEKRRPAEKKTPGKDNLFERNLAAFERKFEAVHKLLASFERTHSTLVHEDGDADIEFRGERFYGGGAKSFAERQIDDFLKTPFRIRMSPPMTDTLDDIAGPFTDEILRRAGDEGIEFAVQPAKPDCFCLLVFGVGLGVHIEPLVERTKCRVLFLVEPNLEFLYHSLFVTDWEALIGRFEEEDMHLFLEVDKNYNVVAFNILAQIRARVQSLLDGTIIYTHYHNEAMERTKEDIFKDLPMALTGLGFVEDEMSYCQKLCMGLSCGGAILAFSIDEFDASNDLGELI